MKLCFTPVSLGMRTATPWPTSFRPNERIPSISFTGVLYGIHRRSYIHFLLLSSQPLRLRWTLPRHMDPTPRMFVPRKFGGNLINLLSTAVRNAIPLIAPHPRGPTASLRGRRQRWYPVPRNLRPGGRRLFQSCVKQGRFLIIIRGLEVKRMFGAAVVFSGWWGEQGKSRERDAATVPARVCGHCPALALCTVVVSRVSGPTAT